MLSWSTVQYVVITMVAWMEELFERRAVFELRFGVGRDGFCLRLHPDLYVRAIAPRSDTTSFVVA